MSKRSNFALKSYIKTTIACLVLVFVALLLVPVSLHGLANALGGWLAAASVLIALVAATFACASIVVLLRYRRGTRCEEDLFLELNRSREAAEIEAAAHSHASRLRRWLARRLLGHDFVAGDLIEVKPWVEIRATLDERGCLEQLPFMPEMLPMCGQRTRVFRCAHRLFDYRKTRRMRHMTGVVLLVRAVCGGSSHGNCEAACHTIWKAAWLRRVEHNDEAAPLSAASGRAEARISAAELPLGTQAPPYACQLTQLHAASQPIEGFSATNFLRPLIAGNVAPKAFMVGWMTHLFNQLQYLRGGVDFPAFEDATRADAAVETTPLQAGDPIIVRSSAEIRATLNGQSLHRGLYFEPDMLKHCGRRYRVQAQVKQLIDIVSGEMLTMKTPAYTLRDVHFSGERQLFNAQYEPLLWRSEWLRRDVD